MHIGDGKNNIVIKNKVIYSQSTNSISHNIVMRFTYMYITYNYNILASNYNIL